MRIAKPALDLQIEQDLIGVPGVSESAERRPLQPLLGARAEIAIEPQGPVDGADDELIVVGIEQFDAVLGAFRKRRAMPGVFLRAVGARLALSRPAGNFEPGAARGETRLARAKSDLFHAAALSSDRSPSNERVGLISLSSSETTAGALRFPRSYSRSIPDPTRTGGRCCGAPRDRHEDAPRGTRPLPGRARLRSGRRRCREWASAIPARRPGAR